MPSTYVSRSGRLSMAARRYSPIGSRVDSGKSAAKKTTVKAPPPASRQVKTEEEPELIQPEEIKKEVEVEPIAIDCRTTAKRTTRIAEKSQEVGRVKRSQELVHLQPEEIKMEAEEPVAISEEEPVSLGDVKEEPIDEEETPTTSSIPVQDAEETTTMIQPTTSTAITTVPAAQATPLPTEFHSDVVQEEEESVHDFLARIRREVQAMDEGYKQMEHERRQTEILDSLFRF